MGVSSTGVAVYHTCHAGGVSARDTPNREAATDGRMRGGTAFGGSFAEHMAYADQGMSRNRMMALGAVVLLHVLLGYVFVSGLALKAVKVITGPIETFEVKEEAPPPEEPPPPPPKLEDIPPYVPPPDVVIETAAPPPPTITTQTTVATPEPPRVAPPAPPAQPAPPAPPAIAPTPSVPNARTNTISEDDYPDASRRAEEQGVVRVQYTVTPDGRASACTVVQGSGFSRLDEATCRIVERRFRFRPATREGQPVAETKQQNVRWQLRDAR